MRLKHVLLPLFLLLASFARADGLQSTTFTKTGQSPTVSLIGTSTAYHKLTWTKTGTVSACSVRVDSSSDGITWNVGDIIAAQTCTSSGTSTVTNFVVNYVRVNMVSFTGTGSVTAVYTAYVNNPAGGGGTPGGSDTQVQFNDGGAFAGDPNLTYNKATGVLSSYGGCAAGQARISTGTSDACSSVVNNSTPPTTPPSIGTTSLTLTVANDTTTGTTLNKLVKLTATGKAIITSAGDTTGVVGICASGCGTTGDAQITVLGTASCVTDNATTINHQLVPSASVAGDCSDAGATYPTGIIVVGQARDSGAAGTHTAYISTDFASATNPGGGKGQNVTINGTAAKVIANLNDSTPAAPGGNTNVSWQISHTGNTTNISGYVPNGGATTSTHVYPLQDCVADTVTNPGNSFYTVSALTNFKNFGHWEFLLNTNAEVNCQAYIPHTVAGTPNAKIRLVLAANDSTASHTDSFQTCDVLVSTTINVGSFTCASAQNFTTTSTAYAPVTLDFNVQATVTADSLLDIQIKQAASNSVTANVFAKFYLVIDETE